MAHRVADLAGPCSDRTASSFRDVSARHSRLDQRGWLCEPARDVGLSGYGRPMKRVALVVALGAVLGACAAPVAGKPSAAPAVRPRVVRLEGVDSCSLLTSAQVAQLGLEGSGLRDQRYGEDSCAWSGFTPRAISTLITTVPSRGIEDYDTDPSRNNVTVVEVRGFPAIQLSFKARPNNCAVGVDVAPGQVVDVEFSASGR
jgi:Protein of unknown function (DUF3558)